MDLRRDEPPWNMTPSVALCTRANPSRLGVTDWDCALSGLWLPFAGDTDAPLPPDPPRALSHCSMVIASSEAPFNGSCAKRRGLSAPVAGSTVGATQPIGFSGCASSTL